MNREMIKEKIREIRDGGEPEEIGIPLSYKGKTRKFKSFKIPLTYLLYNKKNGRIASRVKSYEREREDIDVETKEGKILIEKFLWGAHLPDNKKTEESIAIKGQLVRGIVTNEGIIVDGNRRAMLLNKIYFQRESWANNKPPVSVEHAKYFTAIILPDDATREVVEEIEIETQFGEEEKIGYNPIEKYLKARDLLKSGQTPFDISRKMNITNVKIVDEYLERMFIMEDYLEYCNCEGIYTQLDGREDLFIKLHEALKKYGKGRGVCWAWEDTDINELKCIVFDYIRMKYEGKEFREIFSVFEKKKQLWEKFKKIHSQFLVTVKEPTVEEVLEEKSDNETKALAQRDEEFTRAVKINFEDNLREKILNIRDLEDADKPEKLINRVINALNSINPDFIGKDKKKVIKKSLEGIINLVSKLIKGF